MEYKGAYDSSAAYSAGSVVVFADDNIAYVAFADAAAGETPHEVRKWKRLNQPLQEMVVMLHGAISSVTETVDKVILNDSTLVLATETSKYAITVDDEGDTPSLEVEEITEEEGGGSES